VSNIVKRSGPGEVVFSEGRRGRAVGGIALAVLLAPGTFVFFLAPGEGGPAIGIIMALLSVAGLSVGFGGMIRDARRNRDRITVTRDAVTFRGWNDGQETAFRRADGDLLLVIPKYPDRELWVSFLLTQLGTGRVIGLSRFPRRALRRACQRRGWRFGYDPGPGERHLRLWRDWGEQNWNWRQYAASLVRASGPVDVAAEPDGPVSLGAVILGEYAAGLPQGYRGAASAYRLAADAQRSFAARATVAEERAARLAEADKLQAEGSYRTIARP
jgi:hypothetical protein